MLGDVVLDSCCLGAYLHIAVKESHSRVEAASAGNPVILDVPVEETHFTPDDCHGFKTS